MSVSTLVDDVGFKAPPEFPGYPNWAVYYRSVPACLQQQGPPELFPMAYRARLIIPLLALLAHANAAPCQMLYLDSNGDGLNHFLEYGRGNTDVSPDCITE